MSDPGALPGNVPHGPRHGRLAIVAAALLWSSSGLFAKAPLFCDWPDASRGTLLAFWRAVFAALVLLPTVRRPRWRWELVPLVLAFTGMNATYLSAMSLTTAANAIWLQSTCPWWVFLFSVLVFRTLPARRELVPLAFGVLGVGLILACEIHGQAAPGVTLGVAAGVCYALVVICMSWLRAEDPAWLVAVSHAVAAVCLLPAVIRADLWPTAGQLAVLAGFGIFQMALPYLLLIHGLRSIGSQEAVAIGLLEPVLMPLWVFLVWGERPAWWTLAGAALILVGLMLRYSLFGSRHKGPG